MYVVYRILLLVVYLAVVIHCQGGGGGDSGGDDDGGYDSGGGYDRGGGGGDEGRSDDRGGRRRSSCETEECKRRDKIVGYCFLGLIGFMLPCACIYFCCCDRRGQPCQDNLVFVNLLNQTINQQERSDISPFQSGIWSSRYFQYGSWHGSHQFPLVFDSRSMTVTGTGSDDVGVFTITGIYSNETNRIGLTKTYQAGTGNQSENLGHHVTIQLTWNVQDRQFVGKWYVQTNQYRGQDAFELRYNKRQQFSVHED